MPNKVQKQVPQETYDGGGLLIPVLSFSLVYVFLFTVATIGLGLWYESTLQDVKPTAEPSRPAASPPQTPAQSSPSAPQTQPGSQTPALSQAPEASTEPGQQSKAPAQDQSSTASSIHNFSGGHVLINTESNNNNDLIYHTWDCQVAEKITSENSDWYDSEQAAEAAGRHLCVYCARRQ